MGDGQRGTDCGVGWCLEIQALGSAARRWVVGTSRFGIGARAAVIAAFGVLILRAAARGSAETTGAIESIHTVAWIGSGGLAAFRS